MCARKWWFFVCWNSQNWQSNLWWQHYIMKTTIKVDGCVEFQIRFSWKIAWYLQRVTWYFIYSRYRVWSLYKHGLQNLKNDENIEINTLRNDLAANFFILNISNDKKGCWFFQTSIYNVKYLEKFSLLGVKRSFTHICRAKFLVLTCSNIFGEESCVATSNDTPSTNDIMLH